MKFAAPLLLSLLPATFGYSQTAAKKPVTHRATTASSSSTPPNIPKVAGIAKPLYALRYIDTKVGSGPLAPASKIGTSQADSTIEFYSVQYTGWLAKDGTKFDSSADHPGAEPITIPIGLHRVIPGWDTGFEGMHVGGKRRLFIPWQLAYGEAGRAPVIPARADLIFDVELVSVSDKPPAPPTPPQAPKAAPDSTAKPPADPTKPITDPATNDPAKATTPDNATKPAPKPQTNPPGA